MNVQRPTFVRGGGLTHTHTHSSSFLLFLGMAATKYELIKTRMADINFEVWVQSEGVTDYTAYVLQQRTVADVGALGVIGRSGWFIPVREYLDEFGALT